MGRYFSARSRYRSGIYCFRTFPRPTEIFWGLRIGAYLIRDWVKGSEIKDLFHVLNASLRVAIISRRLADYDVIHVHGLHNAALSAVCAAAPRGLPTIVTIHSYSDVVFRVKSQKKRVEIINKRLASASGIIHVSNTDRDRGLVLGVYLSGWDFVVHNGVSESSETVLPWTERNGFCFVGSLQERKRVSLVLEARRKNGSPGPTLVVAGSGPEARLVQQADQSGEPVTWAGSVDNSTVRQIMRNACVLVVPSKSESFGLVYIEALMEGAAVIGYAPVINEFCKEMALEETEKRLLVPFDSGCDDSSLLAKLMSDTLSFRCCNEGEQAMNALREKVVQHFGWKGIAEKMSSVYQKVVGNSL